MGIAVTVALLASAAGVPADTPEALVREFYARPIALAPGGMPSPQQLKSIARYFTPRLVELLSDAQAKEVRCAKLAPRGIKPPMWEGGVFSGMTEGATRLVTVRSHATGGRTRVAVTLELVDRNFPIGHAYHSHTWRIDVVLAPSDVRWAIDDLVYASGGSLRGYLLKSQRTPCAF